MKKILPLALALALAACAAPAQPAPEAPAPSPAPVTVGRLFTVPRTTGTSLGWNTGTACYELAQSAADYDRSARVLKTDYATAAQTPVCAVPGCTHDSDRCPAWLPNWERHSLLVLGEEVFLLYTGFSPAEREALYGRPWEEYWATAYDSIVESGALDAIADMDAYKESVRADYALGRSPGYLDKISADGAARSRVFTLSDARSWNAVDFQWCDGAALYGVQVDPYQQLATALVRLDLATGEAQDCPLLDNEQVLGVEGSRFVTVRYVSDEPLDPNADPELYNARMQNATAEFGLLTFPTGEREVLFREPNDRTVFLNGFLGVRDGVLYFEKHNAAGDGLQIVARDLSGAARVVTEEFPSQGLWVRGDHIDSLLPVDGSDPLRWLLLENLDGQRYCLNVETGEWQALPGQAVPVAQTADGRWMVGTEFHTPGTYGRYNYALLSPADLFAGSETYDTVVMWP